MRKRTFDRVRRFCPLFCVVAFGVVAGLSLDRALAQNAPRGQTLAKKGQTPGAPSEANGLFRYGQIPKSIPVLPPVTVDYRSDSGGTASSAGGPISIGTTQRPSRTGGVAASIVPCNFDIECNDCNLCTFDTCSENVCVGGQRDGFGCDVDEDCEGVCQGGASVGDRCVSDLECCGDGSGQKTCVGGLNDGLNCNVNGDCDSNLCQENGVCKFNPCTPLVGGRQCVNADIPFVCKGGTRDGKLCDPAGPPEDNLTGCPDLVGDIGECGGKFVQGAECDDGLECNGPETCVAGACVAGADLCAADLACDEATNTCKPPCFSDAECETDGKLCTKDVCDFRTCVGGTQAGANCETDANCPGGTCSGGGTGLCIQITDEPCGPGATCQEGNTCVGGLTPGILCSADADCTGGSCSGAPKTECGTGRCCDGVTCSDATFADCTPPSTWLATEFACREIIVGGVPIGINDNCPFYASGIAPQGSFEVAVPITSFDPCGGTVERVGDDYKIGDGTGWVSVELMRFAASVQFSTRFAVEFWDLTSEPGGTPLLIENVFFPDGQNAGATGFNVFTVDFDPPLTIPASGVVALSIASSFGRFANASWLSTTSPVDVGDNDATILYTGTRTPDGAGTLIQRTNALGVCNGGTRDGLWCSLDGGSPGIGCDTGTCTPVDSVMAFELVGQTGAVEPRGGCCDVVNGSCTEEIPWVCEHQGNVSRGTELGCAVCLGGGIHDGQPCTVDTDCTDFPLGAVCSEASCFENPSTPCLSDAECTATPDDFCVVIAGCSVQACCVQDATLTADPNDQNGDCVEVQGSGSSCPAGTTSSGVATSCVPNACDQIVATGVDTTGDNCRLITPPNPRNRITVPKLGDPPVSITITGNNTDATFDDWNTGECVGGANDGLTCFPNPATCVDVGGGTLQCSGGANDGLTCTADVDCNPDQCPPDPADPTNTGTCTRLCGSGIFNPDGPNQDPGWWASFSIDKCADVRIDLCTSDPIVKPAWGNLFSGCPCDTVLGNAGINPPLGVGRGTTGFARGGPFCDDDNLWQTYLELPPGTYYYPILSEPTGAIPPPIVGGLGAQFQVHVAAQGCGKAACCMAQSHCVDQTGSEDVFIFDVDGNTIACDVNDASVCVDVGGGMFQCSGGPSDGLPCTVDADCKCPRDPGTPAQPRACAFCAVGEEPDCDNADGFWLAEENTPAAFCEGGTNNGMPCVDDTECPGGGGAFCKTQGDITTCNLGGGATPCDTGACCGGPGECSDRTVAPIGPMDRATCELTPGNTFRGGAKCAFDPAPCPVCTVESDANCHPDNGGFIYTMDRINGGGRKFADNFIPAGTQISQVCHFGAYTTPGGGAACSQDPAPDYEIRFYLDDNGVPGALLPDSPGKVQPAAVENLSDTQRIFSFVFDTPVTVDPANEYWIEISNSGAPDGSCISWTDVNNTGDHYALWEFDATSGWTFEDHNAFQQDMAFCLGSPDGLGFTDPPTPDGACCACGGNCIEGSTWQDCVGGSNLTRGDAPLGQNIGAFSPKQLCADVGCVARGVVGGGCPGAPSGEAGEDCVLPLVVGNGVTTVDTRCSTTDGRIAFTQCDTGDLQFTGDRWLQYTATCTGRVVIDACGDDDYDSVLALYTDPNAPKGTCPGNPSDPQNCEPPESLLVGGQCVDAVCNANAGGLLEDAGTYSEFANGGQCFLLRVGGFNGDAGTSNIDIKCIPTLCRKSSAVQMVEINNASGDPVQAIKQRTLSFTGGDPGLQQAVRVTAANLPDAFSIFSGTVKWVGEPKEFSESGGRGYDRPCTTADPCDGPTYLSATLQCEPFFTDWTRFTKPIHVRDDPLPTAGTPIIIPSVVETVGGVPTITDPARYLLQFVEKQCNQADENSFGPPLEIINPRWADNGNFSSSGEFIEPDKSVDVAIDLVANLDKFRGLSSAATKTHFDIKGVFASEPNSPILDGKITVGETTAILDEFRGVTHGYPFLPGAPPCSAVASGP